MGMSVIQTALVGQRIVEESDDLFAPVDRHLAHLQVLLAYHERVGTLPAKRLAALKSAVEITAEAAGALLRASAAMDEFSGSLTRRRK
jgi:hypothetical protein